MFPYPYPSDSWLNMSFFYGYGHDFPLLSDSYKATRLSWILKGWLIHAVFPPVIAYYVLHLGVFAGIVIAFYVTVCRLVGPTPAFVATVAFATYSQFQTIIAFEWNYTTHDGALNLLLCMLFLQWAANGIHSRLALILAGAAWASAVQSPYNVSYFPMMAYWYVALNHAHARNGLLVSAGWFLGGCVAITLLYGLVNWSVGWPFWFFLPEFQFALADGGVSQYRYQPGYWAPLTVALKLSKGLVLPLLFAIACPVLAWLSWKYRQWFAGGSAVRIAFISYCIGFAPHVAWHLYGHPFLSDDHFLVALAPAMFLAFAGIISLAGSAMRQVDDRLIKIVVPATFLAPLAFGLAIRYVLAKLYDISIFPNSPSGRVFVIFAATAIFCGALNFLARPLKRYLIVVALCLAMSVTNIVTMSVSPVLYDVTTSCAFFESQYKVMAGINEFIFRNDHNGVLRIWFQQNEMRQHPNQKCQHPERYFGFPVMSMSAMFNALHYARYHRTIRPPEAVIVATEADRQKIVSLAPPWVAKQWERSPNADPRNVAIFDTGVFGGLPSNWGGADEHPRSMTFANVPDIDFWAEVLPDNTRLAILASDSGDPARAVASLRKRFSVKEVAGHRFESGGIAVDVLIIDVTPARIRPS
jgi:hypothetical protein